MRLASGLRRHIFEPLWGIYSRSPRLRHWRELEKSQWLPPQAIVERQWQRFHDLLVFVSRNNPFYRRQFAEHGLDPSSIRSPEDLPRIPLLSKREVREQSEALISDGFQKDQLLRFKTGGSTGKALALWITEEVSERRNAAARRSNRWSGWEPGEPVGAVWGNPELPKRLKEQLRNRLLEPTIFLDTMSIDDAAMEAFAAAWQSARPTALFGHAHSLYILARWVQERGETRIRPRGIISTSMMLLPHERKVIEQAFGRPVFDRYGCEEVGLIGAECDRHRGMHLNADHLLVEIIQPNGQPAAPGQPGAVVVTDLLNRSMPFIRYRIEDVACRLTESCPCGRGLPLLGPVAGRVADFLKRRDGSRVAGISLIENSLTQIEGLVQMQIVQEAIDRLVLNLVPDSSFGPDQERALIDYFAAVFSGALIEIRRVDELKQEPNGKYRFSICRIPE